MTGEIKPEVTRYTRVKAYAWGRDNKYGPTRNGLRALRKIAQAMRDGHTVSMREYVEDGVKYFDAEIQWERALL